MPDIVGEEVVDGALPLVVDGALELVEEGNELDELGAAPLLEALVVVAATLPDPAVAAQEQIALAAARIDAADAAQDVSTQPSAADWMAEYWELEH